MAMKSTAKSGENALGQSDRRHGRRDIFVAAFVATATLGALLTCLDSHLSPDSQVHRVVSIVVPFDALIRFAEWNAVVRLGANSVCIAMWSTAVGCAATWIVPPLLRYARSRSHDFRHRRYRLSVRELLLLVALLAILVRIAGPPTVRQIARWRMNAGRTYNGSLSWLAERFGTIHGVTEVRITRLDPFVEGPERTIAVTNVADIEEITAGLAVCVRVAQYNDCIPSEYRIEMLSGDRVVVRASPTACCGIFGSGDAIYRDWGTLRYHVAAVYQRETAATGGASEKANDVSSPAQ